MVIPFTEEVVVLPEDQFVVAMRSRSRGAPSIGITLVQHFTESTGGPVIDLQDVGKRLVNGLPPQARMSGLRGSRERLPVMRSSSSIRWIGWRPDEISADDTTPRPRRNG